MTSLKKDGTPSKPRGFAAIVPERRRAIASKGGKSVPPEKRAYSQNADLAAKAGAKGGKVSPFTPEEQAAREKQKRDKSFAARVKLAMKSRGIA